MLRRVLGLFAIFAMLLGPSGCLSDHCVVYPDHCVEIAAATETSGGEATSGTSGPSDGSDTSDMPDLPNGPAEAPTLELRFSPIKQFEFSWSSVLGATHYRLFERPNADAPFVQIGGDLDGDAVAITMPLHFRVNASYKLLACDAAGCLESAVVDVVGNLAEAVGYFKASAPGESDHFGASVALSNDGNTLVVGTPGDDSASGAVHVFARSGDVWSQQAHIAASNPDPEDGFGSELALSDDGDTLAVAAPYEDSDASGINGDESQNDADNAGAVYVFVRNGEGWLQQAYVKGFDVHNHDRFGTSVALSGDGDTLAVGVREGSDVGAIHVFVRAGQSWSPQIRLQAFNADDHDRFGASLALSSDGNTLAVGAPFEDDLAEDAGAVYLYARNNGFWWQQAYINASDAGAHHYFGTSVALSGAGDALAVGAPGDAMVAGAVHLFVRSDIVWSQQARVEASNPDPGDSFGERVALSKEGDVLAVGARQEMSHAIGIDEDQTDNSLPSPGAVYVLVRAAGVWSQRAYVKASNTGADDEFGASVALSSNGATLAVGAHGEASGVAGIGGDQTDDSMPNAGAVYLY